MNRNQTFLISLVTSVGLMFYTQLSEARSRKSKHSGFLAPQKPIPPKKPKMPKKPRPPIKNKMPMKPR